MPEYALSPTVIQGVTLSAPLSDDDAPKHMPCGTPLRKVAGGQWQCTGCLLVGYLVLP